MDLLPSHEAGPPRCRMHERREPFEHNVEADALDPAPESDKQRVDFVLISATAQPDLRDAANELPLSIVDLVADEQVELDHRLSDGMYFTMCSRTQSSACVPPVCWARTFSLTSGPTSVTQCHGIRFVRRPPVSLPASHATLPPTRRASGSGPMSRQRTTARAPGISSASTAATFVTRWPSTSRISLSTISRISRISSCIANLRQTASVAAPRHSS